MTTWFLISGDICLGGIANSQVQKYRRKSRPVWEGNELSVGHIFGVPVDKAWRELVIIFFLFYLELGGSLSFVSCLLFVWCADTEKLLHVGLSLYRQLDV